MAESVSNESLSEDLSDTNADGNTQEAASMNWAYAAHVVDGQTQQRQGSPNEHPEFDALVRTIWRLRQPDGCPWDRKQTHASIASNMIEEAYEAVDVIESEAASEQTGDAQQAVDPQYAQHAQHAQRHLAEELGDVLMQVVLQSQIAADAGEFTIDDVCRSINEKLVRRHPHVFGDENAQTAEDVKAIWSQVKLEERRNEAAQEGQEQPAGLLDSVPKSLPALMACQKISRKAAAAGFEWDSLQDVWKQVTSEIDEYNAEQPGSASAELEFGDILFALVNVARWQGIDAEGALRASNAKFRRRWAYVERKAWESGRDVADLSNSEQEAFWAQAKALERQGNLES